MATLSPEVIPVILISPLAWSPVKLGSSLMSELCSVVFGNPGGLPGGGAVLPSLSFMKTHR